MGLERELTLEQVAVVMRRTFRLTESISIGRETTNLDVPGWDSLSHALLIMGIEEEFGLTLPLEKMYDLANVGELVDLISGLQASA